MHLPLSGISLVFRNSEGVWPLEEKTSERDYRDRILHENGITQGFVHIPGGRVYYNSKGQGEVTLLCVPGGPGGGIHYLLPLFRLANDSLRVVIYDQLGVGQSDVPGDDYYSMRHYADEIDSIRKELCLNRVILLGHSFGSFIVNYFMVNGDTAGVEAVIHYSGGASLSLYMEEANRLVDELPGDFAEIIHKCESLQEFDHPEYLAAKDEFSKRHGSTIPFDTLHAEFLNLPEPHPGKSFEIMWGHCDWTATGRIIGFEVLDQLSGLQQPHLILNGRYDMCTPATGKAMADRLPKARRHVFEHSSHVAHLEQPEEFYQVVGKFINEYETMTAL